MLRPKSSACIQCILGSLVVNQPGVFLTNNTDHTSILSSGRCKHTGEYPLLDSSLDTKPLTKQSCRAQAQETGWMGLSLPSLQSCSPNMTQLHPQGPRTQLTWCLSHLQTHNLRPLVPANSTFAQGRALST